MKSGVNTRQRILEESLRRFNRKGYSSTTLAEIAESVGIAEGNLWYHFRTKQDLLKALIEQCRSEMQVNRKQPATESVMDDYVAGLLSGMRIQLNNRFLIRDHLQFSQETQPLRLDPDMKADRQMIARGLQRMQKNEMFRRDLEIDLDTLGRSLWILCRYWPDHLYEQEGLDEITWENQLQGLENHFTLLRPYLTAAARNSLQEAWLRVREAPRDNQAITNSIANVDLLKN